MPNELEMGTRRVGDFIDFNPDTPEVKVTLEKSGKGISVTIPWSDDDSGYATWFTEGRPVLRIPPGPEPLPVPKRVLFHDSHGSVLLIRCWPRGFHANMLGPGSGTLWARAAIMGPKEDVEFEQPHGLQTEISGLRAWLGVSSWAERRGTGENLHSVTLSSRETPTIQVGERVGIDLSFQPIGAIARKEDGDRRILKDLVRCITKSAEPLGWDDHLQVHRAIRDLLVLSRWRSESCVEIFAMRNDDPIRTLDGKTHGPQWRTVVVPDDESDAQPSGHWPHLYRYDELQEAGILRWLSLREEFSRALDPVISSIDLRGTTANTMLAHTGPGLEALGYLLLLRDGQTEGQARRATLAARFERILEDLGDCLPFDGPCWVQSAADAYNGLKHANRAEPDPLDVLNAWRECVIVVRAWVGVELGVPLETVKARLVDDRQRSPFVKVE